MIILFIQGLIAASVVIIPTVLTLYAVKSMPILRLEKRKHQS